LLNVREGWGEGREDWSGSFKIKRKVVGLGDVEGKV
jgi:hypothetical protein